MSKARVVVLEVTSGHLSVTAAARAYGLSRQHIYRLLARYRQGGLDAVEPRSRRPASNPHTVGDDVIAAVVLLREQLTADGLDAGPQTLQDHLAHHGLPVPSTSTIRRILHHHGLITPQPRKRPRSSYRRFAAEQPNECWQSDFTHWTLADGTDVEVLNWLDDHSRYLLSATAHPRVTGPDVVATFTDTATEFGLPASTLTDNGAVFRIRHDTVDQFGKLTLRHGSRLHDLGIGITHAHTPALILVAATTVTVISKTNHQILSSHHIDPDKNYWRNQNKNPGRWPGNL